jgi:hypothetical protein
LQASFSGRLEARPGRLHPLDLSVEGKAGEPLRLHGGGCVVESRIPLAEALTKPLDEANLRAQLGKLGETGFVLRSLESKLEGRFILPITELNRMRRQLIDRLAIDPGIGFGKTTGHNLQLIAGLGTFAALGRPVLLGASRKSFLATAAASPEVTDRDIPTAALTAIGYQLGARLFRVHAVRPNLQALSLAESLSTFL